MPSNVSLDVCLVRVKVFFLDDIRVIHVDPLRLALKMLCAISLFHIHNRTGRTVMHQVWYETTSILRYHHRIAELVCERLCAFS